MYHYNPAIFYKFHQNSGLILKILSEKNLFQRLFAEDTKTHWQKSYIYTLI